MDKIFGTTGLLATHIGGYESRPGQLAMARAVADLLAPTDNDDSGSCASLVVEAETGLCPRTLEVGEDPPAAPYDPYQ